VSTIENNEGGWKRWGIAAACPTRKKAKMAKGGENQNKRGGVPGWGFLEKSLNPGEIQTHWSQTKGHKGETSGREGSSGGAWGERSEVRMVKARKIKSKRKGPFLRGGKKVLLLRRRKPHRKAGSTKTWGTKEERWAEKRGKPLRQRGGRNGRTVQTCDERKTGKTGKKTKITKPRFEQSWTRGFWFGTGETATQTTTDHQKKKEENIAKSTSLENKNKGK